jgi:hypothetical protein
MTKDEALDKALEALENSVDLVREDAYNAEKLYGNYPSRQGKVGGLKVLADDHEKAITAIKQARSAPVQEPVAWRWKNNGEDKWLNEYTYLDRGGPDCPEECEPLYATPPAQPAPVQEPVASVPIHPKTGPLWAMTTNKPDPERLPSYPLMNLYTTPPAAQPAVPDAIIEAGETPDYRDGWNDCRAETLKMRKP